MSHLAPIRSEHEMLVVKIRRSDERSRRLLHIRDAELKSWPEHVLLLLTKFMIFPQHSIILRHRNFSSHIVEFIIY